MTLILYESPQRLPRTLEDILQTWGDRRMVVARELTKLFEEFFRGTVQEALLHFRSEARGEMTLVVEGAPPESAADQGDLWREELLRLLEQEGATPRDAAERIARQYGLPRRTVYQEALRWKEARGTPSEGDPGELP